SGNRSVLFVAKQRVDAVPVLRQETVHGVLSGRKAGAVDHAPESTIAVNQGVFPYRHLLIHAHLVLAGVCPANKASLVGRLFSLSFRRRPGNMATLHTIAPDLLKKHTR